MSEFKSGLQYDELGFLIGLKQSSRDVSKIDKNVEQIRDILLDLGKEIENLYSRAENESKPKLSALEQALIDAQIKPADFSDLIREQANPLVQSSLALERAAKSIEDLIVESRKSDDNNPQPKAKPKRRAIEINSTEDVIREFGNNERQRDANGRFIGSNSEQTTLSKVTQTIGTAIKGVLPSNPQGVDPTLDAINEVATVLSPVKRAAGFMLRPLTGWMKSRKRNEPLPKEQSDHNRKLIKVLEKIAANNGGGLFGLLKILPMALAGIGSTVAAAVAGLGPVLATALAGAVGAYLGSKIHDKLDETETGQAVNEFIGNAAARTLASLGNDAAKEVVEAHDKADDAERYKSRKENPAWYSNDGVYRFARKLGVQRYMKENTPGSMLYQKQYGGQGVNGKEVAQFGAAASSVNGNQKQIIGQMYDAAISSGFSHNQTIALLGDIGRENDFQLDNIFGSHKDPARGENLGMVSWQGDRRKNLEKYLSGRGLLNADGTIKRSQEGLQAQFEFAKMEMKNNKKWKQGFLDKKDISIEEARPQLGGSGSYFGWARGQETIRRGDGTRVPFNSQAQENKANQYSKAAEDIVGKDSDKKAKVNAANKFSTSQTAEVMMQKAKMHAPVLNMQASVQPIASRSDNLGSGYFKSKIDSNIQPAKEYINSPAPQEVIVRNQNNGNITQNVSNRLLAHAITGGLGMGDKFNG